MPRLDPARVAAWCGGRWDPAPPPAIGGVTNSTQALAPGDLYVALRGERFDGHDFVPEAFARGASAALVARTAPGAAAPARPHLVVADTARALLDLGAAYRASLPVTVVGVTGSAGKSTVKEMTAAILAQSGPTARTRGNWNNAIGLPLSLLAMEPGSRWGVFEIGMNHPGETAPLARALRPDWGIVTNVGPVHLEFFPSVAAIADEKAALLGALPPGGTAVLCADSPWFGRLRAVAPGPVCTVALAGPADYRAVSRNAAAGRLTVVEAATGEAADLALPVPGEHNLANALLAVAAARGLGAGWDAVRGGLAAFRPLAMRWEAGAAGDLAVINDAYNANPLGVRAALSTFAAQPPAGRKWVVLGGMLELGAAAEEEHRAVGAFAARWPWEGIVAVGPLGRAIADGARAAGAPAGCVHACADNAAAARLLAAAAAPGDAVLVKGSRGMKLEEVVDALRRLRS